MDETHAADCLGTHPTGQACDASHSPPGVALGPLSAAYPSTDRERGGGDSPGRHMATFTNQNECGPRRPGVCPYSSAPVASRSCFQPLYEYLCGTEASWGWTFIPSPGPCRPGPNPSPRGITVASPLCST
ncbi:unnamed protein product [Rangifer tarandus platyrhynchus]|uniref:Uncharacterized protein n=2 Tax=Rangifer tarandus platyrhynchus TaxID=3082113 RepID=A0AC59ZTX3_RANTA|nr:unnamed protein product [Rangifer tarandus platyrhynchus]